MLCCASSNRAEKKYAKEEELRRAQRRVVAAQQAWFNLEQSYVAKDLRMHTRKGVLVTALLAGIYSVLCRFHTCLRGVLAGGPLATDSPRQRIFIVQLCIHGLLLVTAILFSDAYWLFHSSHLGSPWGLTLAT